MPVIRAINGALVVLVALCGVADQLTGLQQPPLKLSAEVGKPEYFEGEPIYVVFRLRNTSTVDTAWVGPFQLMPDYLKVTLKRSDGSVVPQQVLWIDYATDTAYRGMPVPPGEQWFQVILLQESWGVEPQSTERVFLHDIAVESYTLSAQFDPQVRTRRSAVQDVVVAPKVSFVVRHRTRAEEVAFHEVRDVMELVWDRVQRPRFVPALLDLADRHLQTNSTDPYLAYLLNHGVVMAQAAQQRLDSTQNARVMAMRIATARAQRALPAGALVAQGAFFAAREIGPLLSETLGSSLAGDVVRADVAKHSKPIPHQCDGTKPQQGSCKP